MLWVDKHRPKSLQQLSYHPETTVRLERFAADPASLPHLLVYGPSGSGKKTRVTALLRAIYGIGVEKLRLDSRTFTTPTGKSVEVKLISSNHHVEMSPGDAGLNDRFVVQEVIKEMASNRNLNAATSAKNNSADYKVVVLVAVDQLTKQAQAALRRTMEKYAVGCRLILLCNNPSKVIDPVRSRCLGIRIAAPSHDDVSPKVLSYGQCYLCLQGIDMPVCAFHFLFSP